MRREREYFGDKELALVYTARRLKEALRVETVLDAGGLDYAVVPTEYTSGTLFFSHRVGAFFYVEPEFEEQARALLVEGGFQPYEKES